VTKSATSRARIIHPRALHPSLFATEAHTSKDSVPGRLVRLNKMWAGMPEPLREDALKRCLTTRPSDGGAKGKAARGATSPPHMCASLPLCGSPMLAPPSASGFWIVGGDIDRTLLDAE
jgi:hypothetical protein